MKMFGCTVYIKNLDRNISKLDSKAKKSVFVGYASNKKGYKCFDPITKNSTSGRMYPFLKIGPISVVIFRGR